MLFYILYFIYTIFYIYYILYIIYIYIMHIKMIQNAWFSWKEEETNKVNSWLLMVLGGSMAMEVQSLRNSRSREAQLDIRRLLKSWGIPSRHHGFQYEVMVIHFPWMRTGAWGYLHDFGNLHPCRGSDTLSRSPSPIPTHYSVGAPVMLPSTATTRPLLSRKGCKRVIWVQIVP